MIRENAWDFEGSNEWVSVQTEILVYMIYWEGPEYPQNMYCIFDQNYYGTPKYQNVLGNSSRLVLLDKRQKITLWHKIISKNDSEITIFKNYECHK